MLMLFLMGIYSCTLAIWVEEEQEHRVILDNGGIHPDAEIKRMKRSANRIIREAQSKPTKK